jgi:hypothetical protein
MPRLNNKTLLVSLGFADKDRGTARHDMGCQYLGQRCIVERLWEKLVKATLSSQQINQIDEYTILKSKSSFELPIIKGEGKYKTTVGFIDLHIRTGLFDERPKRYKSRDVIPEGYLVGDLIPGEFESTLLVRQTINVEVKTTPTKIGDILRQINLYRTFADKQPEIERGDMWALAANFPMTEHDVEALRNENIRHLILGDDFEKWCQEQEAIPTNKHRSSIEI